MLESIVLFNFFASKLSILNSLPEDVRDPDVLAQKFAKMPSSLELKVPLSSVVEYNQSFDRITKKFRNMPPQNFKTLLSLFVVIRMSCVGIAAWSGSLWLTFLFSLLQFIVMPASFFVSTCTLFLLSPAIFAAHYVVAIPMKFIGDMVIPDFLCFYLEINNLFILSFIVIDQLLCVACYYETPVGKSKRFGSKIWIHVIWGFFNCKTYSLILLFLVRGYNINLTFWTIDYMFGLTYKAAQLISKYIAHWAVLFYHQHRMAHIPRVYDQAHKFHHYLHDTTSFDAHIYGSGAPEEWLCLVVEVGMCAAFGIVPVSLSSNALMQTWANKIGHTRKDINSGGVNHHADHHTYHRKNFGIYNAILDMLFETNTNNVEYEYGNYLITKSVTPTEVHFHCTQKETSELNQDDMKDYYTPSMYTYFKRLLHKII